MKKTIKKGNVILDVIIIIAIIAIVIIAAKFILKDWGFGKGKGDGKGDIDRSVSVDVETDSEQEQTEKNEVPTEEITVVELKINGNDYIFDNTKYSIDETEKLIDDIKAKTSASVKLVDEDASEKAFTTIKQALKDNNISFTETE